MASRTEKVKQPKGVASKRKRSKSPLWWRWTKRVLAGSVVVGLVSSIALGAYFMSELNRASGMMGELPTVLETVQKQPTVIVSADGKELYRASLEFRRPVRYENIPQLVKDATVAAEDKRFWEHNGIDLWSMPRVFVNAGRKGGGSTLTMQLAKRVYTSPEKSFQRKVRDMALAMMIEKNKTKQEILELYLNQVYYGAGAYGIQAAAEVYFGKRLDKLTISEAALLARCVRRPSEENPYDNLDVALANRNVVLSIMRDEKLISQAEYENAIGEKVRLKPRTFGSGARIVRSPYFVRYVLDQLKRDFPGTDFSTGGYRIETTLNTDLDDYAQQAVRDLVNQYRRRKVTTAAFVVVDDKGRIKTMIGGYDYKRNQYNVISQGLRQPGSSFKPFVYATALSRGVIRPNDSISNEKFSWTDPATGKVWSPKNSGGGYGGSYSVRSAIANSKNVPAVRVCNEVGPETVISYAHDVFGFESKLDPVLSLGLGSSAVRPLELAQGYSVFQSGGNRVKPYGIYRVIGPDGQILKNYEPEVASGVFDPTVSNEMDGFLRAVVTSGTARKANVIEGARGKTGTTQDNRDAWFCGYTNKLIGIGWIANEYFDPTRKQWLYDPMPRVFGGTVTVELWVDVLRRAENIMGSGGKYSERQPERREQAPPTEPELAPIDEVNPGGDEMPAGAPGTTPEPGPDEPVPDATRPTPDPNRREESRPDQSSVSLEVCADSGRRATMYCPETVTRSFPKDRVPRDSCTRHGG